MKNLVTPAGIEPATFRFVVRRLNHCTTAVPICMGTAVITVTLNVYWDVNYPSSSKVRIMIMKEKCT